MKKIKIIISILTILMFLSCEDSFDPFKESEKEFILNCVLKGNQSLQSAYLGESYFVEDFSPESDTGNHTLQNSFVRIWFNDSVKVFSDTLVQSEKNAKNITVYKNDNFNLIPETEYEIEAVYNNGRKLHGITKTPKKVKFQTSSDKLLPPETRNYVRVSWDSENEELYTAARYAFVYFKNTNGVQTRHIKAVPQEVVTENGNTTDFFPEPSYAKSLTVKMNAFDKALAEISEGDPDKENYIILGFILEILIYDRNLTSYYAAKTELSEGFAVTVNETDFTNIEGGKGIFGSFIKQNFSIKFTHDYIRNFGYTPGLTE